MDYFNQESERLIFRRLTLEDIPGWLAFFEGNDRLKFLGINNLERGKEVIADEWVNAQLNRYKKHGLGHLAVELKDGGDFIAMGGIIPRELDGKDEYEISYSVKPKYWGKGYATEIAKKMKEYGTKNIALKRMISIIDVENTPSANVAVKNGMGILFKTRFLGMDVNVYGSEI